MGATVPTGSICPNPLESPGPSYTSAVYPDNQPGIVYQATTGSVGGVAYVPYCSPELIALGPTDIPGGWDGLGAGDVSSLTALSSTGTSQFANLFLGCTPYYNGNNSGTGQGQLTVNIQENYSLVLNMISAKPCAAVGVHTGGLGSGCGSVTLGPILNPAQSAFNDFYLPGPYPAVNPIPMFALYNNNVITPEPGAASPSTPQRRRAMAAAPAAA